VWLQNPSWQRIELDEQDQCKGADAHVSLRLWARLAGQASGAAYKDVIETGQQPRPTLDATQPTFKLAMQYSIDMAALRFYTRRVRLDRS
jgi:hypothetical protein